MYSVPQPASGEGTWEGRVRPRSFPFVHILTALVLPLKPAARASGLSSQMVFPCLGHRVVNEIKLLHCYSSAGENGVVGIAGSACGEATSHMDSESDASEPDRDGLP